MNHFRERREFYRMLFSITLPIALQNLIIFSVSMADTLMLGQVGSAQLSACAQANQPAFVFQLLTFGLAGGGTVLTAQYWGKNNIEAVRKVIGIVVRIAMISSLLLTMVVLMFPEQLMSFYLKSETETDRYILSEAVNYLRIVGFSYFFWGITLVLTGIFRSVEVVKIAVFTSLMSCLINIFFNWVFIFGNLGSEALGIKGAAMGTLIARISECVMMVIYVLFIDKRVKFRVKYIFQSNKTLLRDFTKYSLPVVANELAWSCGMTIQAAILGKLSTDILAANSIATVLQQLATIVSFGVATSAAVIVGKKIGEGNVDGARKDGNLLMIWSAVIGIIGMVVVFILRKPFVSLYSAVEPSVQLLAQQQLIITSVLILFISLNTTSIVGILRGAGDTKFALWIELIALWIIAVPAGLIAGFVFKAPILVTYACLKIDEPIKVIVATIRTKQKKAYRSVTRES